MQTLPPVPSPDPHPRPLLVSIDLCAGRVTVGGDLDRGCAHHLLDALAALAVSGAPRWTVDAGQVTFCDAAGLRALARGQVLAAAAGTCVRVVHAPPFLAHLLTVVGLGRLLGPASGPGRGRRRAAALRGQAVRCSTKS